MAVSRYRSPEERRAQLMAAGGELFMSRGYAATTLDDITRRAGVSKGLFYQYFPSKEALVTALQVRFARTFAEDLAAAAAACPDWPGKLDAAVVACFERFTADQSLPGVLFRQLSANPDHPDRPAQPPGGQDPLAPGHQAAHRHLVDAIAALLDDGVAAGAYRVADTPATALLIFTALHAFLRERRHDIDIPGTRLLRAAQDLVRGAAGVAAAPAAATTPATPASSTPAQHGPSTPVV